MKTISAFDVIGPHMIGPSSSHTAGAVRIGLLTRKLIRGKIISAHITLYGSFAQTYRGHGTDKALVAGILGFEADDHKIRDSFSYAEKAGIQVRFEADTQTKPEHPNTVDIRVTTEFGESVLVRGISIGGGRAELRGINGVEIKLSGDLCTIFIRQKDTPGILAHISGILSENSINIAFMRLYREKKGENAYTIIEVDQRIPTDIIRAIEAHPGIQSAILIQ